MKCAIVIKGEFGFEGVYCHTGGTWEENGKTLINFYNSERDAKDLIKMGFISVLGSRIHPLEKFHSWENREEGVSVFYNRDRGMGIKNIHGRTLNDVTDQIPHDGNIFLFDSSWSYNGKQII